MGKKKNNQEKNSPESKDFIELEGEVIEAMPATTFKVMLDNGQEILAYLSGKMRMYKIKLLPGDRVKVQISPYDLTRGRITFRL
jgi:translation initiation factor IF-1